MSQSQKRIESFEKSVQTKFNIYNSLFLDLPTGKIKQVGFLLPLLTRLGEEGLATGREPMDLLEDFFLSHAGIDNEKDRIEFMFNVIQYVERQVVLFDSVEDAAFPKLQSYSADLKISDFIQRLGEENNCHEISSSLSDFSARLVLTAHPTQFYPQSVLDIIGNLRDMIREDDIEEIDLTLQQLGMTSLLNARKPTPLQEAKNLIYYLKYVYYDAMGELYGRIKTSLPDCDYENPNMIKLGFWPGGDRDGNPYVTADITLQVADELRVSLMKCYYWDLKKLVRKLTFKEIHEIMDKLRTDVYALSYDTQTSIHVDDILTPLMDVRGRLIAEHGGLYLEDLDTLIDKVKIFGTNFAALDIRQEYPVHQRTIEAILKHHSLIQDDLTELSDAALVDILTHKDLEVDAGHYEDTLVVETLKTIGQIPMIQSRNGVDGCHRYIISNSEDKYSVLYVLALLRWCVGPESEVDIIPLFESMEGMAASERIMEDLFKEPVYREHLKRRKDRQTVMLGFSDGTKDGGYLQANWSIFKAKETLTTLCGKYGVKAIFFDGRGGPPARGGGKTHRFYAAQSDVISTHEIQQTIQGQTITSRYGTKEHFTYNCEQLLTAGLSNNLHRKNMHVSQSQRDLLETLANISHQSYLSLKNHPLFIPYLEQKSTLKYYTTANIGSRPNRRNKSSDLNLKDLRAIPFVGSWSQMKQNVPGYFGIGTALKTVADQGQMEALKALFQEMPFFKALIQNSMMSLYKCYFELTAYFAKDETFGEFWNMLHDEFQLSREMTLAVSGYGKLMEEEPISRRSIAIRKQIVLPLLLVQQVALQQIEKGSEYRESYEKLVKRSLFGNINASRNSA